MTPNSINKVSILDDGRVAVFPMDKDPSYQYVYREASGVNWDNELGCFHSTPPTNWSISKWYQQIISVLSSLGMRLVLTKDTEYESELEGFADEIKLADQALYR